MIHACSLVLLVLFAPTQDDAVPPVADTAFPDGDVGALSVKVTSVEPVTKDALACLVEVAVSNRGDLVSEPLVFSFVPKDEALAPVRATRAEIPFHGRIGRPVLPREKQVYELVVDLDEKALKGVRVAVESACFIDDEALVDWALARAEAEREPVTVGKLVRDKAFDDDFGKTVERTTLPLENHLERDVDVLLKATYTNPKKGTTLLAARIAGGGARELVVASLAIGSNQWWPGAEIKRVELVDWCVVANDGADLARALVEETLAAWYRVEEEALPLGADFSFAVSATTYDGKSYDERARGRLAVDAAGVASFEVQGELSGFARSDLQGLVGEVAQALVPPSAADALARTAVSLVRGGARPWIVLDPNPFREHNFPAYVGVVDGRIAVVDSEAFGEGLPSRWTTRRLLGKWFVTGREEQLYDGHPEPEIVLDIDWTTSSWGLYPTALTRAWDDHLTSKQGEARLVLEGWRRGAESLARPSGPPPSGPLADELRAAWDGFYRHPALRAGAEDERGDQGEFELSGAFRVENAGNDDLWEGHEELRGTFRLVGFEGAFWRKTEIDVTTRKLTDDERARLASVVADRFLMWSGRDAARLPRFDEAFAGARLSEEDRWIHVHPAEDEAPVIERVILSGGKVRAIRFGTGRVTQFSWKQVDGALVPSLQTSGREELQITWEGLTGGWVFPSEVVFWNVFSTQDYDWGPETLALSKLKVRALE